MKIAVLRGGPSEDYELSLESGGLAREHLSTTHDVEDVYVDREGVWHKRGLPTDLSKIAPHVELFVNALHGRFGEDGEVQRILDGHNVSYTGPSALSAAQAFNKNMAKQILRSAGLRVPDGVYADTLSDPRELAENLIRDIGGQFVVKPVQGSEGRGVEIVRDYGYLFDALVRGLLNWKKILIEERLQGQEVKVVVIEEFRKQKLYATLPVENHTWRLANLSMREKEQVIETALAAHRALYMRHYSSVDIILTRRGVFVLEVDALPPLGSSRPLCRALRHVGVTPAEFLHHLVNIAMV